MLDVKLPTKQKCDMSNDGALRLTPDEARELREATERLIRQGLSWLSASPDGSATVDDGVAAKDGASGPGSKSPFPQT